MFKIAVVHYLLRLNEVHSAQGHRRLRGCVTISVAGIPILLAIFSSRSKSIVPRKGVEYAPVECLTLLD